MQRVSGKQVCPNDRSPQLLDHAGLDLATRWREAIILAESGFDKFGNSPSAQLPLFGWAKTVIQGPRFRLGNGAPLTRRRCRTVSCKMAANSGVGRTGKHFCRTASAVSRYLDDKFLVPSIGSSENSSLSLSSSHWLGRIIEPPPLRLAPIGDR